MSACDTSRVSVVLPTHNRGGLLARSIRSVLAQSAQPRELIVVDDASDDDIPAVLAGIDSPLLRYVRLDRQSGPAAARNAGVAAARAPWIAFQDSDDEWLPTRLRSQLAVLHGVTDDVALICGCYVTLSPHKAPRVRRPTPAMLSEQWGPRELFSFPFIAPTWLVRRSAFEQIGGFDDTLGNLEDWELVMRLSRAGWRIVTRPEVVAIKHAAGDSLNSDAHKRVSSLRHILDRHRELWQQDPEIHARLLRELARNELRVDDRRAARRSLARALTLDRSARSLAMYLSSWWGHTGFRAIRRLAAAAGEKQ